MSTNENVTISQRETLQSAVARLAILSDLEYERQRRAEAKRLNVRLPQLDADVRKARTVSRRAGNPDLALVLPKHQPWPEPINGAELISELARTLVTYLALPSM